MRLRHLLASVGILALAACGAFAQPTIKKVSPEYTPPSSGHDMFVAYCAVCHGTSGKGDGPAASALKKAPADLTMLAIKNGGKFPDTRISQYIAGEDTVAAHGTRDMPIWGTIFHSMNQSASIDQLRIHNLSEYIKTLQAR